ncbi:MAG: DNA alkylation repair protein [Patescibacteria group bacterium]
MKETVQFALRAKKDPIKAKNLKWFFKTGRGEYGEGDKFLGVSVPDVRAIAKRFRGLSLQELKTLLRSPFHEERQAALFILISQFQKGNEALRKKIFKMYLAHTSFINNWDLVDCSAEHIVGAYLEQKSKTLLLKLARSRLLWNRRVAMIATFRFIKNGSSDAALKIAKLLVHDKHDLIHKAVGWMLREVGSRCLMRDLKTFLRQHSRAMPRTMLRYAIEKFPEQKRKIHLKKRSDLYPASKHENEINQLSTSVIDTK